MTYPHILPMSPIKRYFEVSQNYKVVLNDEQIVISKGMFTDEAIIQLKDILRIEVHRNTIHIIDQKHWIWHIYKDLENVDILIAKLSPQNESLKD